jgi:hypothetical protein
VLTSLGHCCLGVDNFHKQVMIYKKWFSDAGADCKLIDGDKLAEFFCDRGDLAGRICTCTILHNCIFKILCNKLCCEVGTGPGEMHTAHI